MNWTLQRLRTSLQRHCGENARRSHKCGEDTCKSQSDKGFIQNMEAIDKPNDKKAAQLQNVGWFWVISGTVGPVPSPSCVVLMGFTPQDLFDHWQHAQKASDFGTFWICDANTRLGTKCFNVRGTWVYRWGCIQPSAAQNPHTWLVLTVLQSKWSSSVPCRALGLHLLGSGDILGCKLSVASGNMRHSPSFFQAQAVSRLGLNSASQRENPQVN
jgi:hypothetical protein